MSFTDLELGRKDLGLGCRLSFPVDDGQTAKWSTICIGMSVSKKNKDSGINYKAVFRGEWRPEKRSHEGIREDAQGRKRESKTNREGETQRQADLYPSLYLFLDV